MVASRKRRTEEHKLLIASLRILKDFVKACSKASPSASKVFWAGGGIATFPESERTKRSLCKTFQPRNRLCAGLLNWRDRCRARGQAFLAEMRLLAKERPQQLSKFIPDRRTFVLSLHCFVNHSFFVQVASLLVYLFCLCRWGKVEGRNADLPSFAFTEVS
jgi:hypothetical protein